MNNVSVQTANVLIMSVLQVVSIVILARLLSPSDFGLIAAASALVSLATVFSEAGIGSAIVQRRELTTDFNSTAFVISVSLFSTLSVGIYSCAPLFASMNKSPEVEMIMMVLIIPFFFNGISNVPRALLLRDFKYKSLLLGTVIPFFLSINLLSVLLAYYGLGVWSILIGQCLNSVLLFIFFCVLSGFSPRFNFNSKYLPALLYFGGGITLSRIFNHITVAGDKFVLGNTVGVELLGVFDRLYKVTTLISSQVGSIFDNILFPAFSRKQHLESETARLYENSLALSLVVGLAITLVAPNFSYEAIYILLGSRYLEFYN